MCKVICSNTHHFKETLPYLEVALYNNVKYEDLHKRREDLQVKKISWAAMGEIEKHKSEIIRIESELFVQRLAILGKEKHIIELSEICFSDPLYPTIKTFTDAFEEMFMNIGNEISGASSGYPSANRLKKATQSLIDNQTLEEMKKEMSECK